MCSPDCVVPKLQHKGEYAVRTGRGQSSGPITLYQINLNEGRTGPPVQRWGRNKPEGLSPRTRGVAPTTAAPSYELLPKATTRCRQAPGSQIVPKGRCRRQQCRRHLRPSGLSVGVAHPIAEGNSDGCRRQHKLRSNLKRKCEALAGDGPNA